MNDRPDTRGNILEQPRQSAFSLLINMRPTSSAFYITNIINNPMSIAREYSIQNYFRDTTFRPLSDINAEIFLIKIAFLFYLYINTARNERQTLHFYLHCYDFSWEAIRICVTIIRAWNVHYTQEMFMQKLPYGNRFFFINFYQTRACPIEQMRKRHLRLYYRYINDFPWRRIPARMWHFDRC
jgi:hypothetical protein